MTPDNLPTPPDPRLDSDPDFILLGRFNNSLKVLEARYPDGIPEKIAAACMGLTEEEFEEEFQQVVQKLRTGMGVDDE